MRLYPKMPKPALPAFAFFPPYLLHDLIGNIPRRFRPRHPGRPFLQGGRENAAGNQPLLLHGVFFQTARHDSRYGLVAVANKHLFAFTHELDMGAELRFQVADIHGFHKTIIANLTMLVRLIFLPSQ